MAEVDEGSKMGGQTLLGGKIALACYFALFGGILASSVVVSLVLFGFGLEFRDLPFPIALFSLPINEAVILGITLLFAEYKGVSLKGLGLKRVKPVIIIILSVSALLLFMLAIGISIIEETILGSDPNAELLLDSMMPKDLIQLALMIVLSIMIVGPVEELAFRGFIQKGFENSLGKTTSLFAASILFGLLHGLNSPRAVLPVFIVSLVLGYVWQKTGGNTTASAIMHGVYDSVASVAIFLAYISTMLI